VRHASLNLLLLFGFTLLVAGAGCGGGAAPGQFTTSCTLLSCADGLSIDVTAASGAFPAGEYTITVETPTRRREYRCTLPTEGASVQCNFDPLVLFSGGRLVVETDEAAPTVTITIAVGGATRVQETLTPAYAPFAPNGPGCDPVCQRAAATVTFR
jgi:hypothetical protein